jgi:hypothetical protein
MNKKYYNELINIKHNINFVIKNLNLNTISFDKICIQNLETKLLLTNINGLDDNKIYKTLHSLIIQKNNKLHCYNDKCYKELSINNDQNIYFNNEFYIKINPNDNILFIDNEFKRQLIYFPYTIDDIIIKQNYIIIVGENNKILINNKNINTITEYEIVDLYNSILLYSVKKSILIDNNGYIVNSKINNVNVKIILDSIKKFGKIENLIKCYVNDNYMK